MNARGLPAVGFVVVLAEDNDDHALLIRMALERAAPGPVETHRARNGTEALTLVRSLNPNLLLLDLKMPGKTGHEVLKELKEDESLRTVPVAVLTSSDRDEDIGRSYGLGGNHFLTKPENPAELEERLRVLIGNLSEMGTIRRGTGKVAPSGESALGPEELQRRKVRIWMTIAVILAALLVFGRCSGAFA